MGKMGWVRSIRKNQLKFFRSASCQNGPRVGVGFRTSFDARNQNCENTPEMSFGSNDVDWVRLIRKKSTATFFAPQRGRTALGSGFAGVLLTQIETAKTHQT